jgi:polar amino acid transport system substrate-binding protein
LAALLKRSFAVPLVITALLASAATVDAQQSPDPRVADLVRAGKMRVGLFPPQYTKDPATGELKGVWADIARGIAARIGVEAVLIEFPTPPGMVQCLATGACDAGFLAYDPTRAADVGGFSPPFIEVDFTYLVPAGSSIRTAADADRPGIRIAVVHKHASTLALGRVLKQAQAVGADTPDAAFELLRSNRVDAWASIRPALLDYSPQLPGSRVLEDRYGFNPAAMVVPKGQRERLAYFSEFIEEAKASGFVQKSIARAGWRGVQVAPRGNLDARK